MRDLLRNPQHNSAVMAYGITAAGKTYTIEGTREQPGMLPRSLAALFDGLQAHVEQLTVRASYYEVGHSLPVCAAGRVACRALRSTPAPRRRRSTTSKSTTCWMSTGWARWASALC